MSLIDGSTAVERRHFLRGRFSVFWFYYFQMTLPTCKVMAFCWHSKIFWKKCLVVQAFLTFRDSFSLYFLGFSFSDGAKYRKVCYRNGVGIKKLDKTTAWDRQSSCPTIHWLGWITSHSRSCRRWWRSPCSFHQLADQRGCNADRWWSLQVLR